MGETKKLFQELIGAFDTFITKEEKEIGCLTEEEHSAFLQMRNYIDDVFMKKIKASTEQPQKQNVDMISSSIISSGNDDDGADISKRKRSHELEC